MGRQGQTDRPDGVGTQNRPVSFATQMVKCCAMASSPSSSSLYLGNTTVIFFEKKRAKSTIFVSLFVGHHLFLRLSRWWRYVVPGIYRWLFIATNWKVKKNFTFLKKKDSFTIVKMISFQIFFVSLFRSPHLLRHHLNLQYKNIGHKSLGRGRLLQSTKVLLSSIALWVFWPNFL